MVTVLSCVFAAVYTSMCWAAIRFAENRVSTAARQAPRSNPATWAMAAISGSVSLRKKPVTPSSVVRSESATELNQCVVWAPPCLNP